MPTPRTVQLKRSAYTDIGELFGFVIEHSGAKSANSWRTALFQRLETLGERADIWPLTDDAELASLHVREFLFAGIGSSTASFTRSKTNTFSFIASARHRKIN